MSRNLAIKEELLTEQRRENDRLLLSLMPETGGAALPRGRGDDRPGPPERHGDLRRHRRPGRAGRQKLTSDEQLAIVNKLIRQFDAAAESLGVEQIRTLHNGYLASCGLSVPRLDNVRRTVDFAIEMQRIIDRFNSETGNDSEVAGGYRHRHRDQRPGRPLQPGLRHVGRGGRSRLSGAERLSRSRASTSRHGCMTPCATVETCSCPPVRSAHDERHRAGAGGSRERAAVTSRARRAVVLLGRRGRHRPARSTLVLLTELRNALASPRQRADPPGAPAAQSTSCRSARCCCCSPRPTR